MPPCKCQILRLKCTKIDFGCGSAPDPAGGAYSSPPDPLAGFNLRGPTSKGRGYRNGGERERERKAREGKNERGGQGREGEEGTPCVSLNFP